MGFNALSSFLALTLISAFSSPVSFREGGTLISPYGDAYRWPSTCSSKAVELKEQKRTFEIVSRSKIWVGIKYERRPSSLVVHPIKSTRLASKSTLAQGENVSWTSTTIRKKNSNKRQHAGSQVTFLSLSSEIDGQRRVDQSSFFRRLLPPLDVCGKLFLAGFTVGPLVDSLHNQCLLKYDLLPINIVSFSGSETPILATSWLIPPLLGFAYVVLGGILPRLLEVIVSRLAMKTSIKSDMRFSVSDGVNSNNSDDANKMTLAILAVLSSALIIRLSYILEVNHFFNDDGNVIIMAAVALTQWWILDRTPVALVAASITSVGGPLSELPFVAHHCWTYLPEASNYFPLAGVSHNQILESLLHLFGAEEGTSTYLQKLALSEITGPCYFAVTTDAIALGRWFGDKSKAL